MLARIKKVSLTGAVVLAVAAASGLAASSADAAVGSVSSATIGCDSNSLQSYFRTIVIANAPRVRAANSTGYVDSQMVYWRARVVEERVAMNGDRQYVALTDWSTSPNNYWATANAVDNAWTSTFTYMGKLTQGISWQLPFAGGLTTRLVQNEVWFYDTRSGWNYYGTFYSGPSTTSGNNNGVGYCS